jgi:hypothetical protein
MCGVLSASALLAQTSHRRPDPKPPSRPNALEQLEEQTADAQKDDRARQAAAREQRKANRAELNRELRQLIELAQNLQKRLEANHLDAALPVELQKEANELEHLARKIHKRVRGL